MLPEFYVGGGEEARWTADEWLMLTSAVWNSRNDPDPHRVAKICKLHSIPRRTYARLVKAFDEGGQEFTPPPVLNAVDSEVDRLVDECEDICYWLRVWTEVGDSIAGSINDEFNPETTLVSHRKEALPGIRKRLQSMKDSIRRDIGFN